MGDAYYATYFLLCELQCGGIDGVFEQYGARDHLIGLDKPQKRPAWMSLAHYEQVPEKLEIRELKVWGKILVTTLCCANRTSKAELKSLFKNRWHVELDLRNLKTTMGLEMLSCKTPSMAIKELWVYLLAHNLIRLIVCDPRTPPHLLNDGCSV